MCGIVNFFAPKIKVPSLKINEIILKKYVKGDYASDVIMYE